MTGAGDPPDAGDEPFDPYRFGKPDVPPPPEYAPPGYVPDPPAPSEPPPGAQPNAQWPPPTGQWPPPSRIPSGQEQQGQWPPHGQWPPQQQWPSQGQWPPQGQWPHPSGPPPQGGQWPAASSPSAYPPPPPYGSPAYGPDRSSTNGRATTGMVLGIVSILLCWLIIFDLLVIIPALIYSRQGLTVARRNGRGRGQAVAGVVCACVAVVLVIGGTILARHTANACSGINRGSSSYTRCIENHL